MSHPATENAYADIRDGVRALCAEFPAEYHRKVDADRAYPEAFVNALTAAGWLAALIPQEYGGSGLGLAEASVIMEEINRSGGNAGACHGQMANMGTLLRHGSAAQKQRWLPPIARGELRLQSMAVTEPSTGTDTTRIQTTAVKQGDRYVVHGQKVWISRIQHSDLMILLARTTPLADVARKSEGLSIFLVDLRDATGDGKTVMLGLQNEREWAAFCSLVLEQPALATDARFASNAQRVAEREVLHGLIVRAFAALTAEQLVARLEAAQIANAQVNTMAEVWGHAQLAARERWTRVGSSAGPLPALWPPALPASFEPCIDPIPALGEHTDALLAELGYAGDDISALRRVGAV